MTQNTRTHWAQNEAQSLLGAEMMLGQFPKYVKMVYNTKRISLKYRDNTPCIITPNQSDEGLCKVKIVTLGSDLAYNSNSKFLLEQAGLPNVSHDTSIVGSVEFVLPADLDDATLELIRKLLRKALAAI